MDEPWSPMIPGYYDSDGENQDVPDVLVVEDTAVNNASQPASKRPKTTQRSLMEACTPRS